MAEWRERPVQDAAVPRMELAEWADRYGLVAGITTRGQGFDVGLAGADGVGPVMGRWRAFGAAMGTPFPAVVTSHQVHGTAVAWHEQRTNGWLVLEGADGHATAAAGLLLTITVADCVPVYLAAPAQGVVALLHAGWRGVAAGILAGAVETLGQHAPVLPAALVMHCGVGICGSCYEVGPEVLGRFGEGHGGAPGPLDLRGVLCRQAADLGVKIVSRSPWCSAHDRSHFFSHRASEGRAGRMVAYLGRPLA